MQEYIWWMIDDFYVIVAVLFLLAMHNAHDSLDTGGPERPSRRGGVREEGDLCPQTAQAPQRGWLLWKQVDRNNIESFLNHFLGVKARGNSSFWDI